MRTKSLPRESFLLVLACFFFSGAAGLIYQVAWGKALGLIFGHTVYAIATVLAVFMAGLAAGSAYIGRWSEQRAESLAVYAWIEFMVAATGALSLAGLAGVRLLYVTAYPSVSGAQPLLLMLRFLGASVVLFIPTFLMGGTLPVLVRSITRNPAELGVRVSQLYWVNTLGAVVGTLISGFVLLPALGLRLTVASAVALNILAGLIALRIPKEPQNSRGVRGEPPMLTSVATDPRHGSAKNHLDNSCDQDRDKNDGHKNKRVRNAVCAATFQSAASLSLRKNERNTNEQPQPEIGSIRRRVSADYRYIGTFEGARVLMWSSSTVPKRNVNGSRRRCPNLRQGCAETNGADQLIRILSDLECDALAFGRPDANNTSGWGKVCRCFAI